MATTFEKVSDGISHRLQDAGERMEREATIRARASIVSSISLRSEPRDAEQSTDASRDRHRERAAEHDAERGAADRGAAEQAERAHADQRDDRDRDEPQRCRRREQFSRSLTA